MKSKGKPVGKSQRGKQRKFTNFEELQSQAEKIARKKERGDEDESEEDEEESEEVDSEEEEGESEPEEVGSDDEEHKPKGVESLIDIENPNRRKPKKEVTPATATAVSGQASKPKTEVKPELSRREREDLEKQRRAVASISLKSEQARSDMARLALIRAERAQAALKREAAKQQAAAAAAKK